MAAAVLEFQGVRRVPINENGGFSAVDRETLTTVKVQLGFLLESVQGAMARISKLEETRLTARDLEELMSDQDTMRAEKKDLEKRVKDLEEWKWKMAGAAGVVGAVAGSLVKLILK